MMSEVKSEMTLDKEHSGVGRETEEGGRDKEKKDFR